MVKTQVRHVQHLSRMTYHSYKVRCPPKDPEESEDLHGISGLPKSRFFFPSGLKETSTETVWEPQQRTTRSSLWKLSTLDEVPIERCDTVDGSEIWRSPPGMYKTLVHNGRTYLLPRVGFLPSTVLMFLLRLIWMMLRMVLGPLCENGFEIFIHQSCFFFATLKVTQNDEKWLNSCRLHHLGQTDATFWIAALPWQTIL